MGQSRVIALFVMVWWGNSWFRRLPFDLQHIPKLFQKITLSSPHHWRIYTCCGLIYILLCMLHIYGVTSVLQTSLFGIPFGSFKTFDFITVQMHSWLHFSSAETYMILRSGLLYWLTIVSMSHWSPPQVDSVIAQRHFWSVSLLKFSISISVTVVTFGYSICKLQLRGQICNR